MSSVLWNAYRPSTFGCKSGPWERSLLLAGINPCGSRKAGPFCRGSGEPLLHTRHGSQPTGRAPSHAQLHVPVLLWMFHCNQEMNFGVEQCPP